ncbi:MAG: serine/threonine-protein phosphatase, partial [Spirochaetia bacterium]|nr:serine/threonine-protein phosphatase [Spirochaetia bacterium]
LIKKNLEHQLLSSEGPAIGIFKNQHFQEKNIVIEPGDRLYIYSDGVTECLNRNGEEYSEERLAINLKKFNQYDLENILYRLKMDLVEWSDGKTFGDDITLLGIEFG